MCCLVRLKRIHEGGWVLFIFLNVIRLSLLFPAGREESRAVGVGAVAAVPRPAVLRHHRGRAGRRAGVSLRNDLQEEEDHESQSQE